LGYNRNHGIQPEGDNGKQGDGCSGCPKAKGQNNQASSLAKQLFLRTLK